MGMMLGEFTDDLTVYVKDVFPMPQRGTEASVETIDEQYQSDYIELMRQTGRYVFSFFPDLIHQNGKRRRLVSLPSRLRMLALLRRCQHTNGSFSFFSSSHLQMFEKTDQRCVAVVVDPIQSVKGNIVIDAFRLFPNSASMLPSSPLQSTSNRGHITKATTQQRQRGCGREFYRLPVRWDIDPVRANAIADM